MDIKTEKILQELEKTSDKFWNISHQTANFLNMLIKAVNSKNVLELGTSNGYSGLWIADALMETNGHLTTIEFWDKRQSLAKQYFKECNLENVVTFKLGSALDVINNELQNETYDFIFMDANKGQYIDFFKAVDSKLKKGGILTADNVLSHAEKVKPFVDLISHDKNYQTEILNFPAGLLMAVKLNNVD